MITGKIKDRTIKRLREENLNLKAELKQVEADHKKYLKFIEEFEELREEFMAINDELLDYKKKHKELLHEQIRVKNEYEKQFKELINNIKQ